MATQQEIEERLISFNASTGSNTEASGSGPVPALFGFFGQSTTADNWVNLPEAGPQGGLGDVIPGHKLWMNPAGVPREFAEIVEVDVPGNRVRTEQNMGVRTQPWAIGGQRLSLNTDISRILTDSASGWGVLLETAQTIGSAIVMPSHHFMVWGNSGDPTSPPALLQTSNAGNIVFDNYSSHPRGEPTVKGLQLVNLNASKTNARGIEYRSNSYLIVEDCVFGDPAAQLRRGLDRTNNSNPTMHARGCTFQHCTEWGAVQNGNFPMIMEGCGFYQNTNGGVSKGGSGATNLIRCVFSGNLDHGARTSDVSLRTFLVEQCVFHNNTNHGLYVRNDSGTVANSIFTDNGIGIEHWSGSNRAVHLNGCAFRGNGTDYMGTVWEGTNLIYPGADVYVDPANDDYTLNLNDPGGAELRTTGMTYSRRGRG